MPFRDPESAPLYIRFVSARNEYPECESDKNGEGTYTCILATVLENVEGFMELAGGRCL